MPVPDSQTFLRELFLRSDDTAVVGRPKRTPGMSPAFDPATLAGTVLAAPLGNAELPNPFTAKPGFFAADDEPRTTALNCLEQILSFSA